MIHDGSMADETYQSPSLEYIYYGHISNNKLSDESNNVILAYPITREDREVGVYKG